MYVLSTHARSHGLISHEMSLAICLHQKLLLNTCQVEIEDLHFTQMLHQVYCAGEFKAVSVDSISTDVLRPDPDRHFLIQEKLTRWTIDLQ